MPRPRGLSSASVGLKRAEPSHVVTNLAYHLQGQQTARHLSGRTTGVPKLNHVVFTGHHLKDIERCLCFKTTEVEWSLDHL
jgi:hypothetical protein